MDQAKTRLVHMNPAPSNSQNTPSVDVHITGVKVHGIRNYAFLDYGQFPHDANLVLHCLMTVISELNQNGELGADLFLQLDNTCFFPLATLRKKKKGRKKKKPIQKILARENKNYYLLSYLSNLVEQGIFRKVRVRSRSN